MLSLLLTCSVLYAATWNPLTAADFSTALSNSQPGDTIRLCNGKAYVESTGKGFQVTKALTITNLKDSSACNNDNLPIITTAKFVTINKVSSSNTKGMVAQPQYSSTVVSAPSGVSNAYAHGLWTAWGLRYVQARFPNMELSNNVYEYFPKWSEVCIMKFNGFAYGRPWSTDHKKDPSNNLNVLPGPDAIASSCEYVSCRSNGDKISVLNDAKITDYYLITRNTHYSTTIYPIDRLDGTNFKFKGKSIPVYGNTNKWGLIADAQYSFPEDGKDSSQRWTFYLESSTRMEFLDQIGEFCWSGNYLAVVPFSTAHLKGHFLLFGPKPTANDVYYKGYRLVRSDAPEWYNLVSWTYGQTLNVIGPSATISNIKVKFGFTGIYASGSLTLNNVYVENMLGNGIIIDSTWSSLTNVNVNHCDNNGIYIRPSDDVATSPMYGVKRRNDGPNNLLNFKDIPGVSGWGFWNGIDNPTQESIRKSITKYSKNVVFDSANKPVSTFGFTHKITGGTISNIGVYGGVGYEPSGVWGWFTTLDNVDIINMGYSGVHPRAGATINNCRFSNYMLSYCDGGAIYSVGKDRTNARVSVTKNSFKHVDGRKPGNGVWFYKNLACNSAAIYLDDHTGYWKIDDNTLTSLPDDKPYIDVRLHGAWYNDIGQNTINTGKSVPSMVKFFWNADKSNGYPCGVYVDDYPPWEKTSAPKSPCFATRHPTYASYMGSYCNVMSYCQMESFPAKGSYVTFPPLPSQFPAVPGTKLSPYNDGTGFPNSCQQTSGTNIKCAGVTGFLPSSVPSSC